MLILVFTCVSGITSVIIVSALVLGECISPSKSKQGAGPEFCMGSFLKVEGRGREGVPELSSGITSHCIITTSFHATY